MANKSIALTFGRFNPPTVGHQKLIDATRGVNSNYRVYASQTQDKKKNPLNHKEKVSVMKQMFPTHARKISPDKMTTVLDALVQLYKEHHTDVSMVVGSDRLSEFNKLLNDYNGKKARHGYYKFNTIKVISAGERDPDAEGAIGMSASKMRQAALNNDYASFKKGLPSRFKGGQTLYKQVQKNMDMKKLREWVQVDESIIDLPRKTFAKNIFDDPATNNPKLKPEVIAFIDKGLKQFEGIAPIIDYQLIGSILTHRYRADADLDINVWFDAKTEAKHLELRDKARELNGQNVPGTKHPVNYFAVITKEYFERAGKMADATFNIKENKMSRIGVEKSFDVDRYMGEFNIEVGKLDIIKGELQRDVIDYQELADLEPDESVELKVRLEGKLKEIEDDVKSLIDIYHVTASDRNAAFTTPMTPKQIAKWGDQQRLPKNVVYKMLEKYHYLDFVRKLDKIIGDDDRLDDKEIKRLVKLVHPTTPSMAPYLTSTPTKTFTEWVVIDEVAPPGWGHTKAEKEKTKPNKPKSKIGGTAHEFQKDLDSGKFKGLPGDKTYKDKKASMFKLMWAMKNKGDKPHYKPGVKDKLKKKYKDQNEGLYGDDAPRTPKKVRGEKKPDEKKINVPYTKGWNRSGFKNFSAIRSTTKKV